MIYLATPYASPNTAVRLYRFQSVNEVAAILINKGLMVFSPISHSHPIALASDLPMGWEYWKEFDLFMLNQCTELWVLKLDGWRESIGVQAEIARAEELKLPIWYVNRQGQVV